MFESTEYATTSGYFDYDNMKAADFNPYLRLNEIQYSDETEEKSIKVEEDGEIININFDSIMLDSKYAYLVIEDKQFDINIDSLTVSLSKPDYKSDKLTLLCVDDKNIVHRFRNITIK